MGNYLHNLSGRYLGCYSGPNYPDLDERAFKWTSGKRNLLVDSRPRNTLI
jgi:hypothetical protein